MGEPVTTTRRSLRLAEWVRQWNVPLTRFLGRRAPAHLDPEDLAQEVYLRLLRVQDLEAIEDPRAYLYHVARNIAAESRARAIQLEGHSAAILDELIDPDTPETSAQHALEMRRFEQALRDLPARVRAVTYLKLHEGQTHQEIAEHLGISTRMVRKHLTAGYAALRRRLVKE